MIPQVTFPRIEKLDMSNSSCGSLHSCPRKIEFRKLYNNSRRDESYATGTGSAMHAGIQTYLETGDQEAAIWAMMRKHPIHFQKSFSDAQSIDVLYATLMNSMNWYRLDEYELAKVTKPDGTVVPAVEVPFILRIKNFPFYDKSHPHYEESTKGCITVDYLGYMDLIMWSRMEDTYAVWDIKTTVKDSDQFTQFAFHEQCLPYGLVLESLLGNDPTQGFDIAYWSVLKNIMEPKNKFYEFHKTENDIQEWLRGFILDLQAIRQYYNMGWFPRRGSACMGFNRICSNFDFCESRDPKVIEMMLAQDVNQKEPMVHDIWNVIELNIEGLS